MKLKTIAAAALLVSGTVAQAEDGVKISGFIDLNLERISAGGTSATRVSSGGLNASRLVFSGQEELGGGMKALFNHEMQFAADTGTGPTPRQTYVGLSGSLGQLTLGRQNTPSYWIAGYADPSWSADYSRVSNMQFFYAPYRENNSINYNTPRIGGFMGRFMYGMGLEDGTRAGRYLSTAVEYRNGPFYAGLVSDHKYTRNIFSASTIASARDNYLALAYRMGNLEPTFIYHTYNGYYAYPPFVDFQSKGWDAQIGARYKINDRNRVFASYVHRNDQNETSLPDAKGLMVGYQYSLSKRTDLYANYARTRHENNTAIRYPVTFSSNPPANSNPSGIQLGIRHGF